jgi:hypothetical protein
LDPALKMALRRQMQNLVVEEDHLVAGRLGTKRGEMGSRYYLMRRRNMIAAMGGNRAELFGILVLLSGHKIRMGFVPEELQIQHSFFVGGYVHVMYS